MGRTQNETGTQTEESRRMAQEVEELEENQGEMGYEGSPVKRASECQRKKDAAYAAANFVLFERTKDSGNADLEEQRSIWSSQERKVIAAMENYLERCDHIQVEIASLELFMGQEEAEVCLRYILKHVKGKGSRIFEIFDTKEKNDHLVASRRRCLKHQGERVAFQERRQKRLARHKV